jgi:hypothetical protein
MDQKSSTRLCNQQLVGVLGATSHRQVPSPASSVHKKDPANAAEILLVIIEIDKEIAAFVKPLPLTWCVRTRSATGPVPVGGKNSVHGRLKQI